jgi:hypothetical protein
MEDSAAPACSGKPAWITASGVFRLCARESSALRIRCWLDQRLEFPRIIPAQPLGATRFDLGDVLRHPAQRPKD